MKIEIVKSFELNPGDNVDQSSEEFIALLDYLKTLEFRDTDCSHTSWEAFPSYHQGGKNSADIGSIIIINETPNILTIKVEWYYPQHIAIVSFNK